MTDRRAAMAPLKISYGKSRTPTGLCQNDECKIMLERPDRPQRVEFLLRDGSERTVYLRLCVLCRDALKEAQVSGQEVIVTERD